MSGRAAPPRGPRDAAAPAGRGLDFLNLFVANIQTGFGPFIAVYLTTQGWTQTAIGIALSLSTTTAMASQLPAGAVVDAARHKSRVAALAIASFAASALLFAVWPVPGAIYSAEILHGFSSCMLGPAIAAMSLALVGRVELGVRLGRNARYASLGNGIGAALMGGFGYYISERSVFFLTAALTLPALVSLVPLSRLPTAAATAKTQNGAPEEVRFWRALADRRLLLFAGCAMLFTLASAAMLPLAGIALTKRAGAQSSLLIAACIVLPQLVIAAISPGIGRLAQTRGRRAVLLLGFSMLPLRGALFALIASPPLVVLVQALDGVAGACLGVAVPLVTSDITERSGHFNLSLGLVGFAIGLGDALSTTLGGWSADHFGDRAAFAALGALGVAAVLFVWGVMPETRPARDEA